LGEGVERHQPDARRAERFDVVDARGESREVADAVAVGVLECVDVDGVDDGVLVPQITRSEHVSVQR